MNTCPYCGATTKQVKNGKNDSGSQRYQCGGCGRRYTPEPKDNSYPETLRQQAVKLYTDGMSFRRIGRHLGVDHVTIMLWVKAHSHQLPEAPLPSENPLHILEMDELYTFIGQKKAGLHRNLCRAPHQLCGGMAGVLGTERNDPPSHARR